MTSHEGQIVTFRGFCLNFERGALYSDGVEVALRPKAFAVLAYLVSHAGELVSKEELMQSVWADVIVTDGALTQCIIEIRRALHDSEREIIRTVPRRGFVFEALDDHQAVEESPAELPPVVPRRRFGYLLGALALALLAAVMFITRTGPSPPQHTALAVLPFADISPDGDRKYIADGISEELLNKLAQVAHLRIISQAAIQSQGGTDEDPLRLGVQLNATHLLNGSLRAIGSRLRVSAQLTEVRSGLLLWSNNYDAELTDLIAIQEQIAGSIASRLRSELLTDEILTAVDISTDDPQAYDWYLQAKEALRSGVDEQSADRALALLDRALLREPLFAEAEAARCAVFRRKFNALRDTRYIGPAIDACRRAIDIAPNALEPQVELGNMLLATGQSDLAVAQMEKAVGQYPISDSANLTLAEAYAAQGRTALAERRFAQVLELGPANPLNWNRYGRFLSQSGELERGAAAFRRAISLDANNPSHYNGLGITLSFLGRFYEAGEAFESVAQRNGSGIDLSNAASNYYFAGQYERARDLFGLAVAATPEEFRIWGNLGDTCALAAFCEEPASYYYNRALELAKKHLEVKPNDAETIALIGNYLISLGRVEEGLAEIEAASLSEPSPETARFAAQAYAQAGLYEQAGVWLDKAVELGYPKVLLEADPVLGKLEQRAHISLIAN